MDGWIDVCLHGHVILCYVMLCPFLLHHTYTTSFHSFLFRTCIKSWTPAMQSVEMMPR